MFAFGKNWDAFSQLISEDRIALAEQGLRRLFPNGELNGKPFFDIGCGSGLSMVAALRLGASEVNGIDIDPDSVSTAQRTLELFSGGKPFKVKHRTVFDLDPQQEGTFPIVHSWGVLHHTGDLWTAIERASRMTTPKGIFALAIYRKTPCCPAWQIEKHIYSSSPKPVQSAISGLYKTAFFAGQLALGRNPIAYVSNYNTRGMSWSHDVHDWLGGYPYQSATPSEIKGFLEKSGWEVEQKDLDRRTFGLFGSYCNEYVATRKPNA